MATEYKIDLSKLTGYDCAVLVSELAARNPFIMLDIIDKCVEGGIKHLPVTELEELLWQFNDAAKLYLSPQLNEVADIVNNKFKTGD